MCNYNKEWRTICRGIDLPFQSWHRIWKILTQALESLKNVHFNGLLLNKEYILFDLKKYGRVMIHDSEKWCKLWRGIDLWFEKWQEEFRKFSPEHLKASKLGFWWNTLIENRKCMSLKFTEELRVMTMNNDAKFGEVMTCCFTIDIRIWSEHTSLKHLHFNGSFLSNVCNIWAKKVQRSYVW